MSPIVHLHPRASMSSKYSLKLDAFKKPGCVKVDSHILRYDAARHEAVRQKRVVVVHTCSVSRCKRSNTASSHLVTSLVFMLRNIAEEGKYYLFALVKKSFGNPEAN